MGCGASAPAQQPARRERPPAATMRALGGSAPVDVFDEDEEEDGLDDGDSADDAGWDAMEV